MKIVQSALQFRGYRVNKAQFDLTGELNDYKGKVELAPVFRRAIHTLSENRHLLLLGVQIGDIDGDTSLPFYINVEIEGDFALSENDQADILMKQNAVAILFPYLRSTLTMLTTVANINPIILPTINLAKMFESEQTQESDDGDEDGNS